MSLTSVAGLWEWRRGHAPLTLLKLVKKRWSSCAAASFAPPPLDKFLDPLLYLSYKPVAL